MTFYLQESEAIPEGVRRIANEQVDKALFQLTEGIQQDPNEAIHDTRKRFKKIRALLRLVRNQLGEEVYQRENTCFRDMGRCLADIRDTQVQIETLSNLTQHFDDVIMTNAFNEVQQALLHYHLSTRRYLLREQQVVDSVLPQLKLARARIIDWPLQPDSWEVMEGGLKRVYKRGYKRLAMVLKSPTVEHLHDWRKRAKYLRYHMRILRRLWPKYLNEYEDHLHTLTDYLGKDHDLSVLEDFILSQPRLMQVSENLEALLALIEQRKKSLKTVGIHLGQQLYAEKPQAFIARFSTYWQLWRNESSQQLPEGFAILN